MPRNKKFNKQNLLQSNARKSNVAKPLLTNNPKNVRQKRKANNLFNKMRKRKIGNNRKLASINRGRMAKIQRMRLKPLTYNWIEALVDPLNNTKPVVLPDGKLTRTISLTDYASESQITAPYNAGITVPVQAFGVLITFMYGNNLVQNHFSAVTPTSGYWMQFLPVDANNDFILDDNSHIPNPYYFQNNNNVSNEIADLAKVYRLIAGGFRFLPKVELATSDTTQRVTHFHGCCLQTVDLYDALSVNGSALQLVQSSPGYQEYTNSVGICMRYNPCQDMRQLDFYSNTNLLDTSNDFFGNFYQPAVLINFLNPITVTSLVYNFPIMWDAKLWLEGDLHLPTPIAMSNTTKDIMILTIIRQLNNNGLFPCIVEGHSFKNFAVKVIQFCSQLQRAINFVNGAATLIALA